MIYITGDTHGRQDRFMHISKHYSLTSEDTLLICGDFGYLFYNDDKEKIFLNDLSNVDYTICFIDGNHENFVAINQYPQELWNGGKIHRITKNIIHLMRGQVFTIEGVTFFTMGGAYSIDRSNRVLNQSYWEEELPNKEEYDEAIRNLTKHNNSVDYVLSHTCPKEIVRRMGFVPEKDSLELVGFLEYLMYELSYKHWYFGHFHLDKKIDSKFTALWYSMIPLVESTVKGNFAIYSSPVGYLKIEYRNKQVYSIKKLEYNRIDDFGIETVLTKEVNVQLQEYFQGNRKTFTFPYHLEGTPFQQKVWNALCAIPYGQTCSYKDIAVAIGKPAASRAVGNANRNNPLLIVVPCHRVIGTSGQLTGYVGGVEMKKQLLAMEMMNMGSSDDIYFY